MAKKLSNFEIGKNIMQEFVDSDKNKIYHIFYPKVVQRLAIHFPNLKFKSLGKTSNCWSGQLFYCIQKNQ